MGSQFNKTSKAAKSDEGRLGAKPRLAREDRRRLSLIHRRRLCSHLRPPVPFQNSLAPANMCDAQTAGRLPLTAFSLRPDTKREIFIHTAIIHFRAISYPLCMYNRTSCAISIAMAMHCTHWLDPPRQMRENNSTPFPVQVCVLLPPPPPTSPQLLQLAQMLPAGLQ